MQDSAHILQEQVRQAATEQTPLSICGGRSKKFYGRPVDHERLQTSAHTGITEYSPTELVITARAGTPLRDIESTLANNGQMLACEPPDFDGKSTFGGMLAAGLSGPSRPFRAAVQDTVLGCTILNGKGEILRFGGKVMKNVAGYDVSRLMVGALGCLGVILEATVKVIPVPAAEMTVAFAISRSKSVALVNNLRSQGMPVTASVHDGQTLRVRFSAGRREIDSMEDQLEKHYSFVEWQRQDDNSYWPPLRHHELKGFDAEKDTWRLSTAPTADVSELATPDQPWITEWGGALHWLQTNATPDQVFDCLASQGGHATRFRRPDSQAQESIFQPLSPLHMTWHKQLKQAFDPENILNPGRMYAEF